MNSFAKSFLLVVLVGTPVIAKQPEWAQIRDMFLNSRRSDLMEFCSAGRTVNSYNNSYFNPAWIKEDKAELIEKGNSKSSVEAFFSGKASAMALVCPNVW